MPFAIIHSHGSLRINLTITISGMSVDGLTRDSKPEQSR